MKFIRQGLGIALQPELTLKSIAGELCSVPHEPTFYLIRHEINEGGSVR